MPFIDYLPLVQLSRVFRAERGLRRSRRRLNAATSREFVVRAVVENKRYWSGTLLLLLGTAISIVIAFYWTRLRGLVGARFAGI